MTIHRLTAVRQASGAGYTRSVVSAAALRVHLRLQARYGAACAGSLKNT